MQMLKMQGIPSGLARKLRRKGMDLNLGSSGSISEQLKLGKMSPRSRLRYKRNQRARERMGQHTKAVLAERDDQAEERRHQEAVAAAQSKRQAAARKRKKINTKLNQLEREMGQISIERYCEALTNSEAWIISLYERQQNVDQKITELTLDEVTPESKTDDQSSTEA